MHISLFRIIKNFLVPPFCENCKKFLSQNSIFCDKCMSKIERLFPYFIKLKSGRKVKIFPISSYDGPIKKLALSKNYSNSLASYQIGRLIYSMTGIKYEKFDLLVPIPIHWSRYAKRGFNQAEFIAKEIGKLSRKPVINLLKRIKKTRYQAGIPFKYRGLNVKSAFKIITNLDTVNKHVILVDDIITTGSTLIEACELLENIGIKKISAVVACSL